MSSLRRDVASGLVIVAPVAIMLIVILYVFRFIAGLPVVEVIEPPLLRVVTVIAVFVLSVSVVGYAMRSAVGVLVADLITWTINRVPLLRVVYNAAQLAVETAIGGTKGGVEPVKIESWKGLRVNVFDTGNRTADGRVICFFPTAPNITTGYVIEVEEEDVIRTGESVERALMRILSAGFGGHSESDDEVPIERVQRVEYVTNVSIPDRD